MLALLLNAAAAAVTAAAAAAATAAAATPAAPPRSISLGGDGSRVSVLTSRVLRLEIGGSTDAPTITFPQRGSRPVPGYTHELTAAALTLRTADVELRLALPVRADALGCGRNGGACAHGAIRMG